MLLPVSSELAVATAAKLSAPFSWPSTCGDLGERRGVVGVARGGGAVGLAGEDQDVADAHLGLGVGVAAGVVDLAERLVGGAGLDQVGLEHALGGDALDELLLVALGEHAEDGLPLSVE